MKEMLSASTSSVLRFYACASAARCKRTGSLAWAISWTAADTVCTSLIPSRSVML